MSGKQIRIQVPPELFGVNSWIAHIIRQWIPDCWYGNRKCTGPRGATVNLRNWQLMTSGRSQMLATRNFRDWHTVVDEVPWSSMPKTTMDCHSKLVLHSLRSNQPVQVVVHQPWQITLIFPGPCDQTCCSILIYCLTGFNLPHHLWSLLNCFQIGRSPYVANVHIWCIVKLAVCECGQQQTMSHGVVVSINRIWRQTTLIQWGGKQHTQLAGNHGDYYSTSAMNEIDLYGLFPPYNNHYCV